VTPGGLDPAQTDALDRDGYVVLPDVLGHAWLERLRHAFQGAPTQNDGTQHVTLTPETPDRDAWEALREHPAILAAAAHVLEGAPLRVRDLHGRNPLPGYGQQGLHADWMPRDTVKPFFVVTAIWMIDDFTPENGATRVVPGSHRITKALAREMAQPAARHPRERIVTGTAGSVLVFNGHTWHSGRKNESRRERRAGQMVLERRAAIAGR
jgi:ectoine hydroxylase-related dioxygenase (phytanoyl-CoA dioxygenase family)